MSETIEWASAARPERLVGRRVEFHAEIGSTNDRARTALSETDGDGLAVVADLQTSGRGRRGRTWASPAGRNLMLSVGLRPMLPAAAAGRLGMAAALAVQRSLQDAAPGHGVAVRWPNDIVDGEGRKLAGLLVETAVEGDRLGEAIIGIGINVNWPRAEMPPEIAARATSVADLVGRSLDRVSLLTRLLDMLDEELRALRNGGSPVERLLPAFALRDRLVEVDTGSAVLEGTAAGVDDTGALLLDTAEGRLALSIGEVVAVRDPVVTPS